MEGNFVSGEMDEKKEQEQLQEEEDRSTESGNYSSEDEGSGDYTSEDEGTEDYGPGGYHPVQIGDSLKSCRYDVRRLLGQGCFSTVWRAWDTHKSQYVALKVLDSAQEVAGDEINILQQIAQGDPGNKKCVVKILDHFVRSVPNGEHVCMVFECLGDDLSILIEHLCDQNRRLPISKVKEICFHILVGLDYLHRLSIIHDDLKPENVVLLSRIDLPNDLASVDLKCKLVDFGKARWTKKEFPDDPQSGPYRSPELILGYESSTSADLWSFACICFELATGEVLFDYNSSEDEGHLKHMMQLLGEMPHKMALRLASKGFHDVCNNFNRITLDGETPAFSNENDGRRLHFQRLNEVLMEEHEFNELDANGMADFLGRILVFDPERRLTAAECLQHPWITQR